MPYSMLSVRSSDQRTPMADEVRVERGRDLDLGAPRLVILVHGFQNSESKAHRSYERFISALRVSTWPTLPQAYGHFWEFHWPGDHKNLGASIATYPVRVPEAIRAGEKLAEFLGRQSPNQEVCLAGHSLGCRVVLETLHKIHLMGGSYIGPTITHVFLLAAAVPVPFCDAGERLGPQIAQTDQYVFHSTRDKALKPMKFGVGQYLYGEHGEAVGCHGEPAGRWTGGIETKLQHGQYWGDYTVASHVGQAMGLASERAINKNLIDMWDLTPVWAAYEERSVDERDEPRRT